MGGNSHIAFELPLKVLLADLVVGADSDGWELNLPDGIVSRLDGGEGWVALPLLHDGDDQEDGQAQVEHAENDPKESEVCYTFREWFTSAHRGLTLYTTDVLLIVLSHY